MIFEYPPKNMIYEHPHFHDTQHKMNQDHHPLYHIEKIS
jgi:hypothetical protein